MGLPNLLVRQSHYFVSFFKFLRVKAIDALISQCISNLYITATLDESKGFFFNNLRFSKYHFLPLFTTCARNLFRNRTFLIYWESYI